MALAVRSFRKVQEVDFVLGETEETTARETTVAFREHEPWKLTGKMAGKIGDRGSPTGAYGSESDVIDVDCQLLRYDF